jgi:hypothetical protein
MSELRVCNLNIRYRIGILKFKVEKKSNSIIYFYCWVLAYPGCGFNLESRAHSCTLFESGVHAQQLGRFVVMSTCKAYGRFERWTV